MKFKTWINTFMVEKGIDPEHIMEIEGGEWGTNFVPVGCVIEYITAMPAIHDGFKAKVVEIDFKNGDVMDFFKHCAKGMVCAEI